MSFNGETASNILNLLRTTHLPVESRFFTRACIHDTFKSRLWCIAPFFDCWSLPETHIGHFIVDSIWVKVKDPHRIFCAFEVESSISIGALNSLKLLGEEVAKVIVCTTERKNRLRNRLRKLKYLWEPMKNLYLITPRRLKGMGVGCGIHEALSWL